MKKSFQVGRPQNHGCDSDFADHVLDRSIVFPDKHVGDAESFERKEQSWSITSQIPSDLTIQVQGITFYVHKYPLVSRSGYMGRLDLQPLNSNFTYDLKLDNFPGGSETFEIILKFCYGHPVDLNPTNVAPLRCASEFLEMTEELEEGNLVSKTEAFLTFVVLSSWRDSIMVLKSCESLSPWAENLQIVRRCSDSIAWKTVRENSTTGELINDEGWWFNDVSTLRIDHFVRIITTIRAKGLKPETVGACIMHYAKKWLPGMDVESEVQRGYGYGKNELQLSILSGRWQEGSVGQNKEQRMVIESLVSILPPQREAVSCKFLLRMLKMAMVYSATPALVLELEKRVGMVLEDANVNDLLIPIYRNGDEEHLMNRPPEECTMHNVDVVQRIIEYFLMHEQLKQQQHKCGKLDISKILDGYLAEIARDPNLSISKFQVLVEALPENARACHDGLYRAIDTYLKTHPSLTEHDRRRLCKAMDCEKLSLDACMHAAQNDRLPLRTVVQVLFSEQVKMREAIQEKDTMPRGAENFSEQESIWTSTKKEIKTIKAELEKVKMKMAEMQRDYSELQQEYEKLSNKQRSLSSLSSGWKRIKNSALFNGKTECNENGEVQQRHNPGDCRVSCRRRISMS
ncbi:hypothetical protein HHK36_004018 [Tetracentron sinense]|uniref:Uncharacterized protein n=1 Tax=Tetracentron sinense TaxID=13715 RepID=A0A835DT10_TETSI|nr:hypothetical protein HHK36_004018 [Tetracentron sinense]